MYRCLELASLGLGLTFSNPLVGCVIVCKGEIIGEGYHHQFGGAHAEVNAINSVKDQEKLKESVLYVNLEPCAHYGKTPPCADLIIQKQIPKVVIANTDPNPKVASQGIKRMKEAGLEVVTGVLHEQGRWLNRRFFTFHEKKRPYIILKWAQTSDGFIDIIRDKDSETGINWITDAICKTLVHKWRSEEMAILTGANTIRNDNPALNVREWTGNSPLRCVISASGMLPPSSAIFDGKHKAILFTQSDNAAYKNTTTVTLKPGENNCKQVLDYLWQQNILSLLIEGGSIAIQNYFEQNLWDEIRYFVGNKRFLNGVKAPEIKGVPNYSESIGNSMLNFLFANYPIDNFNENL